MNIDEIEKRVKELQEKQLTDMWSRDDYNELLVLFGEFVLCVLSENVVIIPDTVSQF